MPSGRKGGELLWCGNAKQPVAPHLAAALRRPLFTRQPADNPLRWMAPGKRSLYLRYILYCSCIVAMVCTQAMDINGVFEALKRCEDELRKLAAEAAAEGDYDTLARLGSTARTISEIARDWQTAPQDQTTADAVMPSSGQSTGGGPSRGRAGRSGASRGYPRFMRRGDELVKIGWSKSDRKEYQHRAAHNLLVALRQALLDSSKRRKLFTMDLLERQSSANGAPGYQAYVWLAWLRSEGLVKQHGRQGYSVLKPATFDRDVEGAFAKVPVQEP